MRSLLVAITLMLSAVVQAGYDARVNYMLGCMGCHLADGAGTAARVPPLKDHVALFLGVPGGREFLIRVPGASQSLLSDAELADVLNYIVTEFSADQLPADFVPYSESEVARWRHERLLDVAAERRRLLQASPADGVLLEY